MEPRCRFPQTGDLLSPPVDLIHLVNAVKGTMMSKGHITSLKPALVRGYVTQ